jgi:3-oxoacyl-[acyl-carrier protein] reductase
MKFKNKVALVTGAGCGIGKAIALAFAREGAQIVVNDVDAGAIETTIAEIVKLGGEGLGMVADVSRSQDVKDMFAGTVKKFGTLDILVNNAGIAISTDAVLKKGDACIQEMVKTGRITTSIEATRNMKDEAWDRVLKVHLYGTFYCTREALNIMEDRGAGKIINMASIAGIVGLPGSPDYSAAKGAIIAFTKSVAREVIGRGVYVNAIAPGWIDTPLLTNMLTPTFRFVAVTQTPVGRMGTPEEVASVAVFLASEDSSFIVGQVICPSGGAYV